MEKEKDTFLITLDHIKGALDYSVEKILEEMETIKHGN